MATPLTSTKDMRGMPFTPKFQAPRRPYNPRYGASVAEIMSQRGNNTGAYNQQGQMLPAGTRLQVAGWNTKGFGPGSPGYRGSGQIGSAAGAVGSSGIPTSQRGRAEKFGIDPMTGGGAWQAPSWMIGQQQRDQFGTAPDWAYGGMGHPTTRDGTSANSAFSPQPNPWENRTTYGNSTSTYLAPPQQQEPLNYRPTSLFDGTDAAYLRRRNLYA